MEQLCVCVYVREYRVGLTSASKGFRVHGSLPPVSGFPAIRNYILKRRVLTVRKLIPIIRQLKIGLCRLILFPNFITSYI